VARRMGVRSSTVVVRGGVRRKSTWVNSADSDDTSSLAGSTKVLDSSLTSAVIFATGLNQSTIVRTRGEFYVRSDQTAATENPFGAFGMFLPNESARVIGATALLGPITDEASDEWYVHGFFNSGIVVASAVGLHGADLWYRYEFDSHAQRKVGDGDASVVMVENAGTTGCVYIIKFRQLFKLA